MWRLYYADGSANLVRLADDGEFEYLPVTPAESSSGSYSGGDPVRARLSPGDPRIAAIRAEVERLFRDARLYPIGGGTREIMNEIISKVEGY